MYSLYSYFDVPNAGKESITNSMFKITLNARMLTHHCNAHTHAYTSFSLYSVYNVQCIVYNLQIVHGNIGIAIVHCTYKVYIVRYTMYVVYVYVKVIQKQYIHYIHCRYELRLRRIAENTNYVIYSNTIYYIYTLYYILYNTYYSRIGK